MKIAFNPSTVEALIAPPNNKDITFDLRGHNIFARGVKFCGTDTNTWRDIKINNVSIDSNILDLRNGSNTTLTNTNGVVTINSTWRPVVDNLTSDSTTSSLSANQGRILKALIDDKSDSGHTHDDRYLRLTGGIVNGIVGINATGVCGNSVLTVGPQDKRINTGIVDRYGTMLQIVGTGKKNEGGVIGFHNPSLYSAIIGFVRDTNETGFIFDTDVDRNSWYVKARAFKGNLIGDADSVDGVHMDWSTNYTAGNYLAIWDNAGNCIRPIPKSSTSVGYASSATKLQTPRTIWGQSFDGTGNVNGTIYINNSNSSNGAIRLNNDISSNARISAIDDQVIFNTGNAIRFGETAWDWNQWAGLKYTHSNKTIYLGIADGSAFNANNAQGGGTLRLPGIKTVTTNPGARIGNSGGDLYLGNANNNGCVKVQDICSHNGSDYWYIYQSGNAVFNYIKSKTNAYIVGNLEAGQIIRGGSSQTWVNGRNGALLRETSVSGYHTLWSLKTTDGSWDFGEYNAGSNWNNIPVLSYITDSNYNSGKNTSTYQIRFPLASGTVALTSNIPNPTNYYWANVKISASANTQTQPSVNTIYANNWFRSQGLSGWHNESYGGGIWMNDSNWIRTYGGKSFYCDNQIYSSNSIRMSNIQLEHTDEINNITNGSIYLNYRNSGNVSLCYGGGNVGIGTASPAYKLDVNGQMGANGFHHYYANSNNYVLLAGGGYGSLFTTTSYNYTDNSKYNLKFRKLGSIFNNLVWVDGYVYGSVDTHFTIDINVRPYQYNNDYGMDSIYVMSHDNFISVDANGYVHVKSKDRYRIGFFYTGRA